MVLYTWWLTLSVHAFLQLASCSNAHHTLGREIPAPLLGAKHKKAIQGSYIVIFREDHDLNGHIQALGRDVTKLPAFREQHFLSGYAASIPDALLEDIRRDPGIEMIEVNRRFTVSDLQGWNNNSSEADHSGEPLTPSLGKRFGTDYNDRSPWGPQAISFALAHGMSHSSLPSKVKDFRGDYDFVSDAGNGVDIYILDTGIRITHPLFGGNARNYPERLKNPKDKSPYCDGIMDDEFGHGTHVASIAGAISVPGVMTGIAPGANLWNVKVLDKHEGDVTGLAKAIDQIIESHKSKTKNDKDFRGSVINISWGSDDLVPDGASPTWERAFKAAYEAGIVTFAAAGNKNKEVAKIHTLPCIYEWVQCVGAMDANWQKDKDSNFGKDVQWVAPGRKIWGADWEVQIEDEDGMITKTGTSQAAPHAAGVAAIITSWLGLADGTAIDYMKANAVPGITWGWPESKQKFLVNSGINLRSEQKKEKEPFIGAGLEPRKDLQTNYPGKPAAEKATGEATGKATGDATGEPTPPALKGPVATTESRMWTSAVATPSSIKSVHGPSTGSSHSTHAHPTHRRR